MDGIKEYLINNEGKLPTSTAGQSRIQIFEPTKSPKEQIRKTKTAWGEAVIDGKLGQNHASLMEAIFFNAEDVTKNNDGSVNIIVDPYKVRLALGGGGREYSYSTMMLYRRDIMKALVELTIKNTDVEISIMTHIIKDIISVSSEKINPLNGKKRKMWRVIVSNEYMFLSRHDVPLYHDPATITPISTGSSQAVARHVLTHKKQPNGGWNIDNILEAVGVDSKNKQKIRDGRKNLKKDFRELKNIGILVDGDKIKLEKAGV